MTTADTMAKLELRILIDIVKQIKTGDMERAAWQAEKLQDISGITNATKKRVASGSKEAVAALEKEIDNAAKTAVKSVDDKVKLLPVDKQLPKGADERVKAIMSVWAERAKNDINQVGSKLINSAAQIYKDKVTEAAAGVATGAFTKQEAMQQIADDFAKQGMPALRDTAGRTWSVEGYSQMVVRSVNRQVATDIQIERSKQYGFDLVEVDSHVGARPGCEPYQGKVYSLSGDSKNYPSLSSTSRGEPAGLFGINCGHNMYPYVPGTEKTYKPVKNKKNDLAYKNSQRQRQLERAIRDAKKRAELEKAGTGQVGTKTKKLLKARQNRMKSFINDTGRTRRIGREKIL